MHLKSSKVCIMTRSPLASFLFKGLATKHTTVKWTIPCLPNLKFKSLSVFSSSPHLQYSLAALKHSFSYKINFLENIKTFKFCLPPNSIKRFTTMSYQEPFLYSHALTYSFLSTVPSFSSFHFISPSNIFSALSSLIMLWLLEILFVSVRILMKAYILC